MRLPSRVHRFVGACALATLCTLPAATESRADTPQRTTVKGQYLQNATYLSHNYVEYPSFVAGVPALPIGCTTGSTSIRGSRTPAS